MNQTSKFTKAKEQLETFKETFFYEAVNEVERLARKVLSLNRKKTTEFVIGMGMYFFTDKSGGVIRDHVAEKFKGYSELENFIGDWNEDLKLSGWPMRFTEKGNVVTDW